MATAIFYASSTGNTADVANKIAKQLGDIEVFDIADDGVNSIKKYDKVILATPTWGEGELQDDWKDVMDEFEEIDFTNKIIALFGLGDQEGYGDFYCDAMGIIYEKVIAQGGTIVGQWDITEEYYHEESKAVVDGKFVGLALDEDNQPELTDERINQWCEIIKLDIL